MALAMQACDRPCAAVQYKQGMYWFFPATSALESSDPSAPPAPSGWPGWPAWILLTLVCASVYEVGRATARAVNSLQGMLPLLLITQGDVQSEQQSSGHACTEGLWAAGLQSRECRRVRMSSTSAGHLTCLHCPPCMQARALLLNFQGLSVSRPALCACLVQLLTHTSCSAHQSFLSVASSQIWPLSGSPS